MATANMRRVHRRNYEILEEARVEQIAMVTRRRRLKWFGHEDGEEASYRETTDAMQGLSQKRHESLEDPRGMGN